jgi:ubiquinone biosynthesis protein
VSDDIAGVLFHHRDRIKEIADVLARYGFARLADDTGAALDSRRRATLVTRIADPDLAALTGQRLRGALSELGTTWIKFGQMLSLHPDLVGNDVAAELAQLQSNVPPDPPGSAESTIKAELGVDVGDAFGTFDATPMASASVAQAQLKPHSRARRPAVPRECASPKLDALNRWTLIVLRIDGRYDLDDGRPLERRHTR